MRLVLQQKRLVTSDTVRELRRLCVRVVERKNLQRVNTCDSGRHSLGSTTQHIYIRVVCGLVPSRSASVSVELARAVACRLILCNDVRPQKTSSTELCHLHKVVRGYGKREADLASHLIDCTTLLHQPYEVVVSSCQRECQLLNDGRTCVREVVSRYGNYTHLLVLLCSLNELYESLAVAASTIDGHTLYEWVQSDVKTKVSLCYTLLLGLCDDKLTSLCSELSTNGDIDSREYDACQESVDALCGRLNLSLAEAETERINTRVEHCKSSSVSLLRTSYFDSLVSKPSVVSAYATQERKLTGTSAKCLKTFKVLGTVVWAKVETLVCAPYQLALIVGTFEVGSYRSLPRLGRNRWELGE